MLQPVSGGFILLLTQKKYVGWLWVIHWDEAYIEEERFGYYIGSLYLDILIWFLDVYESSNVICVSLIRDKNYL